MIALYSKQTPNSDPGSPNWGPRQPRQIPLFLSKLSDLALTAGYLTKPVQIVRLQRAAAGTLVGSGLVWYN